MDNQAGKSEMRRLILATYLISTAFPICSAYAAGNVLLPSSNASGSSDSGVSAAAMGLSAPTAAPAAPQTSAAPPPAAAPASTPASTPVPAPAQTYQTPAPLQASVKVPTMDDILSPADPATAKNLPPGTLPTRILHQPDNSQILSQMNGNLPYGITISYSGQSVFGAKDVQEISSKLGLGREQIASGCSLALSGIVQTSKGSYVIDSGLRGQASVKYDGTIQSYLLAPRAMCAPDGKLPPGSGFITEIGGRYVVPLPNSIDCPVPNRQSTGLVVTYDGSGKSGCVYQ